MSNQDTLPDYVGDHDIDRVTLDVIENTLANTRYEMDRVLETTAVSPVIREQSDQFPLIADPKGRMVIGQFGSAIQTILDHSPYEVEDLEDGDVIVVNDPYMCEGSISHVPDFLVLRPIFYEDDMVGYSSQWGHLMDVGGTTSGSQPVDAESIYEEGTRMPPLKLYKAGELDEELLTLFCHNCRTPKATEADIKAIAAGTAAGARRVIELCERFGKETYLEACDALLDRTRSGVIQLIRDHLPDGEKFTFVDYADDDGLGHGPIKLKLTMFRDGDRLKFDWSGSGDQVPGSVNFVLNPEMFKMFAGIFLIMSFAPDLVFNDGYYDVVDVDIPDGSILKPNFPAPVSNRLPIMARQFDVLQAVFSKALDEFSVSGSYGSSPNLIFAGTDTEGRPFQILEILYGGIPARPQGDGLDGHSWWPMFQTVETEYLEKYYPLRVEEYRCRTDSGGRGEFRGGHGIKKTYTFLEDGTITIQDDRSKTFPWGVDGGQHGAPSRKTVRKKDGSTVPLPSKVHEFPVKKGEQLVYETAGAGGLGDPLERTPERVVFEVVRGLISREEAEQGYGVVLDANGDLDPDATEQLRDRMRRQRDPLEQFDYGPLPDEETLSEEIAREFAEFQDVLQSSRSSGG